MRMLKQQFYYS